MPVKHSSRTTLSPNRTTQTQGIALVVVLLSAMVLMVSLLAITSTVVISSQRTTADQGATLQAQYAAEAGLARAHSRFDEVQTFMGRLDVVDSTRTQIETHARNYCNVSSLNSQLNPPPDFVLCTAPNLSGADPSNRYSLFTSYPLRPDSATSATTYPDGLTAAQFWSSVFSKTPTSTRIATDSANGSENWYTLTYGLTPTRVLLRAPNFYRFEFSVTPTLSVGEVRAGGRPVASRRVQQETSGTFFFDVQLPNFARNFVFRDETTSTLGSQLSFGGGETFNGPIHTNKAPGFLKTSGLTPVFTNDFSSCASSGVYSEYSGSTTKYGSEGTADMQSTFRGSNPVFNLRPCIELPENSNNQKRASFGGDANDTRPVSDLELFNQFRPPTSNSNNPNDYNGVYYSQGDYNQRNTSNSWLGGMYVRGNVTQLKLCTLSGRQIIGVKQGSTVTTFEENVNGSWTVRVRTSANTTDVNNASYGSSCTNSTSNGTAVKTLSGTFNGMIYVEGDVSDMRGNGTNAADVASNSKLMVTSTGKVLLKDSITYTDIPSGTNRNVVNVLGIYSSGDKCDQTSPPPEKCGSILADGANNKDLDIHASIMATKEITGQGTRKGEGFGAERNNVNLGSVEGRKARINLLGGVIERQSQTIFNGSSNGYARNYNYDLRFADGFAPPFFPEQADGGNSAVISRWTTSTSPFSTGQRVWQTVGN